MTPTMANDFEKALIAFQNFRNLGSALVQEKDVDAAIYALQQAQKIESGECVVVPREPKKD